MEQHNTCSFHSGCEAKLEGLTEGHDQLKGGQKDILARQAMLTKLVYIGMGLFLAGGLLVGILFANMNTVKADVQGDVRTHTEEMEKENEKVSRQLDQVSGNVSSLQRQVAVLGSQVTDLRDSIKAEREYQRETIGELKDLLREHAVRDHHVEP